MTEVRNVFELNFEAGIQESAPSLSHGAALPYLAIATGVRYGENARFPGKQTDFTQLTTPYVAPEVTSLVPNGARSAVVAYANPESGPQWIASDGTVGPLLSPIAANALQNGYTPLQLEDMSPVAGGYADMPAAVVTDSDGNVWTLTCRQYVQPVATANYRLFYSVQSATGEAVLTERWINRVSGSGNYYGLTAHGTAVYAWYTRYEGGTNAIFCLDLANGIERTILTTNTQRAFDVVGFDATTAILACNDSASSSPRIYLVDVTTGLLPSALIPVVSGVGSWSYAVHVATIGGVKYWGYCFAEAVSGAYSLVAYDASGGFPGTVKSLAGATLAPPVGSVMTTALAFASNGVSPRVVGAVSVIASGYPATPSYTMIGGNDLVTGTPATGSTVYHETLYSRGSTVVDGSKRYAIFCLRRYLGVSVVAESALHLVTHTVSGSASTVSVLGRIACDALPQYPALLRRYVGGAFVSNAMTSSPTSPLLYLSHQRDLGSNVPLGAGSGYQSYLARFNFTPTQCRYAHDDAGATMIAGALPATWDGQETTEMGPLYAPVVIVENTGGTGPALTGDWYVRAVYSWRDATGQLHRSEPSLPQRMNPGGTSPVVRVLDALSYRSGVTQAEYTVHVYATGNGAGAGSRIYTLMGWSPTKTTGRYDYTTVTDPATYAAYPSLYSTGTGGQEDTPSCPPALWDVRVVGPRAYAISAENRGTVLYSKRKQPGIAHEFVPEYQLPFPATAGKLIAISEVQGQPVFFAESGIYTVEVQSLDSGDAQVSDPRRISDVRCTDRQAVRLTPAGTIFRSGTRYALLANSGAVEVIEYITPNTTDVCTLVDQDRRDMMVLGRDTDTHPVLAHALGRWSRWGSVNGLGGSAFLRVACELGDDAYVAGDASGGFWKMPLAASAARTLGPRILLTGWIAPAGHQGDLMLHEVTLTGVFSGFFDGSGSTGSLVLGVAIDYADALATTKTWTMAEVNTAAQPSGTFSLTLQCHGRACRAFAVYLSETLDRLVHPLSCTVEYSTHEEKGRRFIKAGSAK